MRDGGLDDDGNTLQNNVVMDSLVVSSVGPNGESSVAMVLRS